MTLKIKSAILILVAFLNPIASHAESQSIGHSDLSVLYKVNLNSILELQYQSRSEQSTYRTTLEPQFPLCAEFLDQQVKVIEDAKDEITFYQLGTGSEKLKKSLQPFSNLSFPSSQCPKSSVLENLVQTLRGTIEFVNLTFSGFKIFEVESIKVSNRLNELIKEIELAKVELKKIEERVSEEIQAMRSKVYTNFNEVPAFPDWKNSENEKLYSPFLIRVMNEAERVIQKAAGQPRVFNDPRFVALMADLKLTAIRLRSEGRVQAPEDDRYNIVQSCNAQTYAAADSTMIQTCAAFYTLSVQQATKVYIHELLHAVGHHFHDKAEQRAKDGDFNTLEIYTEFMANTIWLLAGRSLSCDDLYYLDRCY